MPKAHSFRRAFTLIEVMVAVMIVSVVIAALLQMRGNTSHQFLQLKKAVSTNQYSSFLIGTGGKFGFESSRATLHRLLEDFDLESDLRRKLKAIKTEVDYDELVVLDSSDFTDDLGEVDENGEDIESSSSGIVFELGKTTIESKDFSLSLIRVRIQ